MIYEYTDKSPQGCAVSTASFGSMSGKKKKKKRRRRRRKRAAEEEGKVESTLEHPFDLEGVLGSIPAAAAGSGGKGEEEEEEVGGAGSLLRTYKERFLDLVQHSRDKRDVRGIQKFIELALILDKAMVGRVVENWRNCVVNPSKLKTVRAEEGLLEEGRGARRHPGGKHR